MTYEPYQGNHELGKKITLNSSSQELIHSLMHEDFRTASLKACVIWIFKRQVCCVDCIGGERRWYKHGKLHRDADSNGEVGPALVMSNGCRGWYKEGKLHRDPDRNGNIEHGWETPNGYRYWYIDGERMGDNPTEFDLYKSLVRYQMHK